MKHIVNKIALFSAMLAISLVLGLTFVSCDLLESFGSGGSSTSGGTSSGGGTTTGTGTTLERPGRPRNPEATAQSSSSILEPFPQRQKSRVSHVMSLQMQIQLSPQWFHGQRRIPAALPPGIILEYQPQQMEAIRKLSGIMSIHYLLKLLA